MSDDYKYFVSKVFNQYIAESNGFMQTTTDNFQ